MIQLLCFSASHGQKQPPEVFCKKSVLKDFTKFTGKHLCQSLFFNKVAGLPATLSKKRLWLRCFPVNFVNLSVSLLLSILFTSRCSPLDSKSKSLDFGNNNKKKLRTSLEQSQACCPTEHKNKVSRLAILKIIRAKQSKAWLSLILYCM